MQFELNEFVAALVMAVILLTASNRKVMGRSLIPHLLLHFVGPVSERWTASPVSRLEMTLELLLRFVIGGIVVSFLAMLGGSLKPKSFAGLLGAAPSVALATLSLTVMKKGKPYAAIEAQSMLVGAVALLVYPAWSTDY